MPGDLGTRYTWLTIVEWTATACLLASVALSAFDIYPINAVIGLISNVLWVLVGIKWQRWSIVTSSAVVCMIYTAGIFRYLLTMF